MGCFDFSCVCCENGNVWVDIVLRIEYTGIYEAIIVKSAAISTSDKQISMPDPKAEHVALKMKILEYLKEKPTAIQKELQEALNETRTHIQGIAKELVNEGMIERKGRKRSGF